MSKRKKNFDNVVYVWPPEPKPRKRYIVKAKKAPADKMILDLQKIFCKGRYSGANI